MAKLKNPIFRLAVLFGVWAPWLGSLIYFGYDSLFVQGVLTAGQKWSDLLIGTITLYPLSLIFGGIPALLTGAVYAYYLQSQTVHNPSWIKRLLMGGFLGALFSFAYLLAVIGARDGSIWLLTGVGALSGAIGALWVLDGVYFWLFPKRNPLCEQLQRQKDLRL